MKSNKRNLLKKDDFFSNSSFDYELKSDTLDQLYKEQLTDLRDLIFKNAQPNDFEICCKWLKVFNRTTKTEKMARNCLCTLMLEQIKENNCLQEPFTNLQNCNRDLESIMNDLDDRVSAQLSSQNFPSESDDTFKSHGVITEIPFVRAHEINTILQENQNIKLKTETSELTHELQSLHLQLTEKQIENSKLKEIAEKCRIQNEAFEQMLDNMKKSILESIREILLNMEQCGGMFKTQLKFFQNIFAQFSNDEEFMGIVSKYDLDLEYILHKNFKSEFHKQQAVIARHICRKCIASKSKLRQKFENRLTMQTEAYELQLKLAKLNSFSILRQIFINNHNEFGKFESWEILKTLEEKYQIIVNGDLNNKL